MKPFLRFFRCIFSLVTTVSAILLIGLSPLLHSETLLANDSNAPFLISGNLKVTQISDGDSLRSGKLRIRLFGIDAPERNQQCTNREGRQWNCGVAAQKALKKMIESVPQIYCNLMDVDRYSRLIMRCHAGETDVAAALVRAGLALAYRQYSAFYSEDENAAQKAKAGIWDGSFTKPWTWRATR